MARTVMAYMIMVLCSYGPARAMVVLCSYDRSGRVRTAEIVQAVGAALAATVYGLRCVWPCSYGDTVAASAD